MSISIRVLCVDDHPIVREGVAALVREQPDMELVAEADTGNGAMQQFHEHAPDITIIDLRLPDLSGIDVIESLRVDAPEAKFLVLSSSEGDADIRRAFEAGAQAYLIKATVRSELVDAIRTVHAGKRWVSSTIASKLIPSPHDVTLTRREVEILRLVAEGFRNKEIGGELAIAEETVKMHLKNIMQKLGASDRTQAVTIALRRGIIHL